MFLTIISYVRLYLLKQTTIDVHYSDFSFNLHNVMNVRLGRPLLHCMWRNRNNTSITCIFMICLLFLYLFNGESVDFLSHCILQCSLYSRAASRPPRTLQTINPPFIRLTDHTDQHDWAFLSELHHTRKNYTYKHDDK